METRRFTKIGGKISLLGFGTLRLPLLDGGMPDAIDEAAAQRMADLAVEGGVNYFDTAPGYLNGESEAFLGRALKRVGRERMHIATKVPTWKIRSKQQAEEIFEAQLARLGVEYFDFYLEHQLTAKSLITSDQFGVYDFLRRQKEKGRIRHLGFSFHDNTAALQKIADARDWDFAQIQLNYIDWEAYDAAGQYRLLEQRGIPVVVMEPLRGGALAELNEEARAILAQAAPGKSPASLALRFAASLPGVLTVLSGMGSAEQVEENIQTMAGPAPLSKKERAALEEAGHAYLASGAVRCTGCRYCMDCPQGVQIPNVFAVYNHYRMNAHASFLDFMNGLRALPAGGGPERCDGCGRCAELCPQGVNVPDRMVEIAALAQTYDTEEKYRNNLR